MNLCTGASECVLQSAFLLGGRVVTPNRRSVADFAILWRFWCFKGGKRCTGAWIYAVMRQNVFCNLHFCSGAESLLRIGDRWPILLFCDDFDVLKVENAAPAHEFMHWCVIMCFVIGICNRHIRLWWPKFRPNPIRSQNGAVKSVHNKWECKICPLKTKLGFQHLGHYRPVHLFYTLSKMRMGLGEDAQCELWYHVYNSMNHFALKIF